MSPPPRFVCPIDHQQLKSEETELVCDLCKTVFPVINDIPILINEANSVFRISEYIAKSAYEGASGYGGSVDKTSGWRKAYRRYTRRLLQAEVPGSNIHAIAEIQAENPNAAILVVGSGERSYTGNVTYTDVSFAAGIARVCDAHDLPFENESFDAIIADSVLEHVCDPYRCVSEFIRVLRVKGYVMAVTPFLQPVHMEAHDFTRFTYLGHRRLFRQFDDIKSGMCGGPVYSLIHLMRAFPILITTRSKPQAAIRLFILLLTYLLRKTDVFFVRSENAYDTACATYFFGQKRAVAITDRELLTMYRGNKRLASRRQGQ